MNKRSLFTVWLAGLFIYLSPGAGPQITPVPMEPFSEKSSLPGSLPEGAPALSNEVYLPILMRHFDPIFAQGYPLINAPFFTGRIIPVETAIQWFGEVRGAENYADIRLGYNQDVLYIHLAAFDRHTWYDTTPTISTLTEWDAATLLLETNDLRQGALSSESFRFIGQLSASQMNSSYKASYQGSSSGWIQASLPFTATTTYRGQAMNNNSVDDRGWTITYQIPFSSLGLTSPPAQGVVWELGLLLHDRDDASGTPISLKTWPEIAQVDSPSTWGRLRFGLPAYTPPPSANPGTVTIRHRLDGATVIDAAVGGGTTCGEGLNFWTAWGDTNYAGREDFNVQNQMDVADWPCFSKHYVTFPLSSLPPNKVVISASLMLHEFGGSNPAQALRSLIQVLTVGEDWSEADLTWNNAPLPLENVSRAWVDVLPGFPGWPGVPFQWDVSRAVAQAYQAGQPLRLALYSADPAYHSGKYFSSSDTGDWNAIARPTLTVTLGDALAP